jgi:hypothetical protein
MSNRLEADRGARNPASRRPCVLFDSHHPKHYLTVRALGRRCRDKGLDVIWTARDKDVLLTLMREDGFDPIVLTRAQPGLVRKLGELAVYDWKLLAIARRHRPVALLGKTVSLTHVGRLLGIPSILINDDSAVANPQYRYLAYPFATRILTGECLGEDYGPRQTTYPGLMELAYLHPAAFTPDTGIRAELNIAHGTRLFVMRLVAFDAYHDVGQRGFSRSMVERVAARLSAAGQLYIVSEAPLPGGLARFKLPLPASRLHHVLAASDLVLGDGPTVSVEAALLGRPAIVYGSYFAKLAYFHTLAERFGLIEGFPTGSEDALFRRIDEMLADSGLLARWSDRRAAMLAEWRDPTDVYWRELSAYLPPSVVAG